MAIEIKTDSRDETVKLVSDRFTIASSSMALDVMKWRTLIEMYDIGTRRNKDSKRDERGEYINSNSDKSNLSASVLYNNVETVFARLAAMFDPEGWHTVVPRVKTTFESALLVQNMIQQQIDDAKINDVLLTGLKQGCQIGHFTLKLWWEREKGKIYERVISGVDNNGNIIERFKAKKGTIFNGPKAALVNYWNFCPDPKGNAITGCEYVFEDSIQRKSDLELFADMGYYDKDTVQKLVSDADNKNTWGDPKTAGDRLYNQKDVHRNDFRVLVYQEDHRYIYAAIPFGVSISKDNLVILNKNNQDNPYDHRRKQYITFAINFNPESIFPKGIIEPLRDNQAIETAFLNMAVTALVKMIDPMTLYSEDLGLDSKELNNYVPGKHCKVDSMTDQRIGDQMYEIKPDINVLNAMAHIFPLMRQQDEDIGANTQYVTGAANIGSNKTARGVQQLTQNALSRDTIPKQALAIGATELIEMIHALNQQHGDPNTDDIYGLYNFKVFENSAVDKMIRMSTLKETLPVVGAVGGNVVEVLRRIYQTAGISAIDLILPQDGSMQNNQVENMRQQIIMQQGGGNA